MGIEHLYADRLEEAFQRDVRSPPPPAEPTSFSAWSFLKSGAKGLASGGLESTGSVLDFTSGFATPFAASMGDEEARQKMLAGDAFDTSQGNVQRKKADEFAPNPETAHRADQVIHGLTRGVSKAVADITLMGLPAGAVAFGADEGNTATQRLRMEGVDDWTAAKVGLGTAVISGATVAIPGVGPTIAKTVGLAALTGPAAYMAQEALTRDILQRAGRNDLASLHDPLDPLGLSLSIGIPGAVGGLHIRGLRKAASLQDVVKHIESGGQRYGADGKLLTSPAGAQGEMQVMPGTATDPGFGVTPAKDGSPEELARVGRDYLSAMTTRYGEPDKALAAYNAGPGAVDMAVSKHGANWLAHMPDETQKYVAKAGKLMDEHLADRGVADPAVVDAARVRVTEDALMRSMPDHPEARGEVLKASDMVAEGRMPEVQEPTVTLYHGSPHEFDAFDSSKIGTGEGVQVYGHGLYLAESADVAKTYAENVKDMGAVQRINAQLSALADIMHRDEVPGAYRKYRTDAGREAADKYDALMAERSDGLKKTGNVYKVQLPKSAADRMLDWDKPLSQQPRAVRELSEQHGLKFAVDDPLGQGVYERLAMKLRDRAAASDALRHAGVTGITYLDGMSRGAGEGSRNHVIFPGNEKLLTIGERNGVAISRDTPASTLPRADSPTIAEAKPAEAGKASGKAEGPSPESMRVAQLAAENPNLKVRLPGSDETLPVGEALKQAKEAAAHEASEADLVKAAMECALGLAG